MQERSPQREGKEIRFNLKEIELFHSIGKAITSTLELTDVLNIIMEKILELFNPTHWSLLLMDEGEKELRFEVVVGPGSEVLQGKTLPVGKGIAGWVAKYGESVISPNVKEDPRFFQEFDKETKVETKSVVAVPLISKGKVLGVLELINILEDGRFNQDRFDLLLTIADYAAIAIENARYVERIKQLTVTDDVTLLYNARFLEQALEQNFRRARRYKTPLSLIFMDLDHFKHVNDTFGHLVGSSLLKEVAVLLKSILRITDIPTRYGGDEFVVILPETGKEEALIVANRIRDALRSKDFGRDHGLSYRITASFGVSTYPEDADNKVDLLRLADQAMYWVKEHNRDNIATPEVLSSQGKRSGQPSS
jgi:diguanylate cyclase (GGDEF)-like protein